VTGVTGTWTAPAVERVRPARLLDEREALEGWLDFHRATLLGKCTGLSAEQLKLRPVDPSPLSLLGLVRHMAQVERYWFRVHVADRDMDSIYNAPGRQDADFEDLAEADAAADLATFVREVELARDAVRDVPLDRVVRSHTSHPDRISNVRWIFLHVIQEYARHNGHADLLRERIDGATGL
jgi:uncharacterized damage-inducible protein DinB